MQIGIATLVHPAWLKVGNVARGVPKDPMGEPITKEYLRAYDGRIPNRSDESDQLENHLIDSRCFEVTALLRAAARRGRLRQASYFLTLAARDAQMLLDIEKEVREEMIKEDPEYRGIPPLRNRWNRSPVKRPRKKKSPSRPASRKA
jgi:hypothetical protein